MQPLQICIGPIIRIGRENWCLPYAGFFKPFPKNALVNGLTSMSKKGRILKYVFIKVLPSLN